MAPVERKLTAADVEEPYRVVAEVRGRRPLLLNRFDEDDYEAKRAAPRGSRAKRLFDPELLVWRLDGALALPTRMFHKALRHQGRRYNDPRTNRGTAMDLVEEGVVPIDEYVSLGVDSWDAIDRRHVRNAGLGRSPDVRHRPLLHPGWGCLLVLDVVEPHYFAPSDVLTLLELAGRVSGVGDARRLGFGRFQIVEFAVQEGVPWATDT